MNAMDENKKKLIQERHRLEQHLNRSRDKERKARTHRLIQEGAALERILPSVKYIEQEHLEQFLQSNFKR